MSADVILYTGGDSPVCHEHLDCSKCLGVLMPHLDNYRKAERSARNVAEVHFPNGIVFKFSSHDGNIEFNEEHRHKLLGLIPMPSTTKSHGDTSDFEIHKEITRAFAVSKK